MNALKLIWIIATIVVSAAFATNVSPARRPIVAVDGVPATAAFSEGAPQNSVHFYISSTGGGTCTAVTVAFERMLTAAHCLNAGMDYVITKDGIPHRVYGGRLSRGSDTALLYVEGVYCPCAKVYAGEVREGDEVLLVGYPYGTYMPESKGTVRGVMTAFEHLVESVGPIAALFFKPEDPDQVVILSSAMASPGHSGGGLFTQRNGEWVLVGIASYIRTAPGVGWIETACVRIADTDLYQALK